jgi:hypothetical protein
MSSPTSRHRSSSRASGRARASTRRSSCSSPAQRWRHAAIVGERHYKLAQEVRKTLARYEDLKDIIAMLGMEQLSPEDRLAAGRARRLERFLTQPFFTTEQFSGIKGKTVSLKDTLDGCERILRDEFKDVPESALYMIGAIGEAKKPAPQPSLSPQRPTPPPGPESLPRLSLPRPPIAPRPSLQRMGPPREEPSKVEPGGAQGAREPARESRMNLKILLPFQVFADKADVSRIVAETRDGSFGLLPHRLDCVAALAPGILHLRDNRGRDGIPCGRRGRAGQDRRGRSRLRSPRHRRLGSRSSSTRP